MNQKRYLEVEDTDLNLSWLLRHLRNNEIEIALPQPIAQALHFSLLWQDHTQGDSYSHVESSTTHPHQHSDCCGREELRLIPGCYISLFTNFHYHHMLCTLDWENQSTGGLVYITWTSTLLLCVLNHATCPGDSNTQRGLSPSRDGSLGSTNTYFLNTCSCTRHSARC